MCCTILGMPVVPEVKYTSIMSSQRVASWPVGRGKVSGNFSSSSLRSSQPSRCSATKILLRREGMSGWAASTCSITKGSLTQTMAQTWAAFPR